MGQTLPGTALITGGKTAEDDADAGQQGRDAAAPPATGPRGGPLAFPSSETLRSL